MITILTKLPNGSFSKCTRYGLQYPVLRSTRTYANKAHPKKKASTGTVYTIGAIAVVGAATIGYAAYDNDFRRWLGKNVPGADDFLKVILQEERTFSQSIDRLGSNILQTLKGDPAQKKQKKIEEVKSEYTPPRPVFKPVHDPKDVKFEEIRVQTATNIDVVKEKPKQVITDSAPKTLADLERKLNQQGAHAVATYGEAINAFKGYVDEVNVLVESSIDRLDNQVFNTLKISTEKKNEIHKEAEETVKSTVSSMEQFKCLIDDIGGSATETQKATAKRNVDRLMTDIRKARDNFEREKQSASITENYWRLVFEARCHFIDELEIMFPDFDINKKKMTMMPSELDLFLVHAFKHVMHYQKEVQRLQTMQKYKLQQAVDLARANDPKFDVKKVMIDEEIQREKAKLTDEFNRKCLKLRQESEKELRKRLKCQEMAHADHLSDALALKEAELQRDFNRNMDERMTSENNKYRTQMAGMVARMTGMRNAINERLEADKIAHQSQVLWSACQALYRAVKNSSPGIPWHEQMRPLEVELDAINMAAAKNDELVSTVLHAIPSEARTRGVFPEGALRERFLKVERLARRLALVPREGAPLPMYLLSLAQASLLSHAANPIPQDELEDKVVDFGKLDTYDILQRARYWIDRGNYVQTLKYMNLLKGASRCIAQEWMTEARILLETQQAAETLMAHAVASGLLHL